MLSRLALAAAASASGRAGSALRTAAAAFDGASATAHRPLMRGLAAAGSRPSSSTTPTPAHPMPAFVFLGAPGVGKGTYSVRVASALGAAHISAGDIVRAEIRSGTELGKDVRGWGDRGRGAEA